MSYLFVRGRNRLARWVVVKLEGIKPSLFAETTIFTPRSNQPRTSLLTTTGSCFHNTVVWWVSHSEVMLHCLLCPQMCVQYQHVNDLLLKNPSCSLCFSFIFTFSAQPTWHVEPWQLTSDELEHTMRLFWLLLENLQLVLALGCHCLNLFYIECRLCCCFFNTKSIHLYYIYGTVFISMKNVITLKCTYKILFA